MLRLNSKHVQHIKIYLACNFKVNLITRLEVIALFFIKYRCFLPSLAPFGQAVSEEKIFFNISLIRNKNCPWWPYLLAEWNEMKKLYRGPYIDAFCQVWFHLAQLFQRSRLKYEKGNGQTTDAK
jgi:hypothetical protein